MVKINSKLKMLRKQMGINQDEAAQLLNVSLSSYQKYEREKNAVTPSLEVLCKLASFYDVTTDYLLDRCDTITELDPVNQLDMTEEECEMLRAYLALPKSERVNFIKTLKQFIN